LVGSVSADWCTSQAALVQSQLSDIKINGAYEQLANWLLDNQAVGFKGMIHLFSQSALWATWGERRTNKRSRGSPGRSITW
jgi:hypothetical protein